MGAKQTKIEGTYLPETPIVPTGTSCVPFAGEDAFQYEEDNNVRDPRSPNMCRTPINVSIQKLVVNYIFNYRNLQLFFLDILNEKSSHRRFTKWGSKSRFRECNGPTT